jgi:hypothetical protein
VSNKLARVSKDIRVVVGFNALSKGLTMGLDVFLIELHPACRIGGVGCVVLGNH